MSGAELALLFLGAYRRMVDRVVEGLAAEGFSDVRPAHDFAMRAIVAGADSASGLAGRLGVSKQAAAKTIELLVERGYVDRTVDPADARRKRLSITARGDRVMQRGEELFAQERARLAEQIGAERLAAMTADLAAIVGDAAVRIEAPGWVSGA